jgi:hypothetical protein
VVSINIKIENFFWYKMLGQANSLPQVLAIPITSPMPCASTTLPKSPEAILTPQTPSAAVAQPTEPSKKFISIDTSTAVPESTSPALTFNSRTKMANYRTMERLNKDIGGRIAEMGRQNQTLTNLTQRHENSRVDFSQFGTRFLTNLPDEYLPLEMIRPEFLANHDYTARIRVWGVRLHVQTVSIEYMVIDPHIWSETAPETKSPETIIQEMSQICWRLIPSTTPVCYMNDICYPTRLENHADKMRHMFTPQLCTIVLRMKRIEIQTYPFSTIRVSRESSCITENQIYKEIVERVTNKSFSETSGPNAFVVVARSQLTKNAGSMYSKCRKFVLASLVDNIIKNLSDFERKLNVLNTTILMKIRNARTIESLLATKEEGLDKRENEIVRQENELATRQVDFLRRDNRLRYWDKVFSISAANALVDMHASDEDMSFMHYVDRVSAGRRTVGGIRPKKRRIVDIVDDDRDGQ